MRWFTDRLMMGYIVLIPVLLIAALIIMIWQFLDSSFGFIPLWLFGRNIPHVGGIASLVIALIVGSIAETERGWSFLSRYLSRVVLVRHIIDLVDQWKKFYKIARERGVILAPYYRENSALAPAVVTGTFEVEDGSHLVTIVFGDIPLPKALVLQDHDYVYGWLTFGEAMAFMFTGGLALKMFGRRFQKMTLRAYLRMPPPPTSMVDAPGA